MWYLLLLLLALAWAFYWFFVKDVMNRIQYFQFLRIYWITRDNADENTPRFTKAFMRQTAPPFWRGTGYQIRLGKYTFQIGKLTDKKQLPETPPDEDPEYLTLLGILDGRELLGVDPDELRDEWKAPEK